MGFNIILRKEWNPYANLAFTAGQRHLLHICYIAPLVSE